MWNEGDRVLREATTRIVDHVAEFLPGVLVALILVLLTFVAAILVRVLMSRALRAVEFDRRAGQIGLITPSGWSSGVSPSDTVARVAYWLILVLGLLVSLTALNATMPSRLAMSVFDYVPHLLAALLILAVGSVAAQFLSRSVLIGAVNMRIQSARLLSVAVKWLVLLVAIAMALDHLRIGRTILLLAFGILFGGFVLATALAVGLGAKDVVARALERQLREPAPTEDKVDHV
jgi:hypothetical protein